MASASGIMQHGCRMTQGQGQGQGHGKVMVVSGHSETRNPAVAAGAALRIENINSRLRNG